MTTCRAPVVEPSRANPGGDCHGPAIVGVPLGDTGRVLPVCAEHAERYEQIVDLPGEDT